MEFSEFVRKYENADIYIEIISIRLTEYLYMIFMDLPRMRKEKM